MIISNLNINPYNDTPEALSEAAAKRLGLPADKVPPFRISRRSIDARHKDDVRIIYTLDTEVEPAPPREVEKGRFPLRPLVVGSGPAGMLAAYTLARSGAKPIVIERGCQVETRVNKVSDFFYGGELDRESNVQFGEGGAGTFSDGKLTTGTHDERISEVLRVFIEAGAPDDIAYSAKPHIGTDVLTSMVAGIRGRIIEMGGEYRFNTKLSGLKIKDGRVTGAVLETGGTTEELDCDRVILAVGHSARDTFEMLLAAGVKMESKPFSVGARIEHPQELINRAQYGRYAGVPSLGAADYKLSAKASNGRGVYTFCMCPGGTVVAATSEPGAIVTNGMSRRARNYQNANSAILVSVERSDLSSEHPLAGVTFQRSIERAAFGATQSFKAPAQLLCDFMAARPSRAIGKVSPSYRPGVYMCELGCCLPGFVMDAMREGIEVFSGIIRGFGLPDAVLTGPETRTSSPVRILRDDRLQSNISGLYPCGEGAGYAGGITSAAVDGIRCAEAAIRDSLK